MIPPRQIVRIELAEAGQSLKRGHGNGHVANARETGRLKNEPSRQLHSVSGIPLASGCALELREVDLLQLLLQNLARLEFNHRALRDYDFGFGLVGVPADALLAHLNFQYPKISQLHVATVCQSFLDDVQRLLHRVDDLFLGETGFPVDLEDYFTFGEIRHWDSFF
jgi:hypothetical protein